MNRIVSAKFAMAASAKLASLLKPANIPQRLLLGPGPSNPSPEVTAALGQPMLGYLHSEYCQVMDDVKAGLQYLFQTDNPVTFAVSGTGHAGMECSLVNLVEPGERVLIAEHGLWGQRASEISSRIGADVRKITKPFGQCFSMEEIEEGLAKHQPVVFFICHGESSTGVLQCLDGLGPLCHKYGTLLLVDTVVSLGATIVSVDKMGIDAIYSGSQKVIGCPPGLAPISFNEKAMQKIVNRKTKPSSFYLDAQLVGNYWGCFEEPRRYHHTGMISLVYALREALAGIAREGLENCIDRHSSNAQLLYTGLQQLGLECFVKDPEIRVPTLTSIEVPADVNWKAVVDHLMQNHEIEIAGGLGPTAGKIWRVGLMGYNSQKKNVDRLIPALSKALAVARGTSSY